ncbi:hypothetical protein [Clavibacter michiganensis]|uniref:hypothetical protein n=1 Tax=Clavibacter michiganensis TaxID=28447 RepID=UPI003DA0CC96
MAERAVERQGLLHVEINLLRNDLTDRRKSVDARAAFLAVASGVVISAAASVATASDLTSSALPLGLAIVALTLAATTSLPERRNDLSGERLIDRYLDSEKPVRVIDKEILLSKVAAMNLAEARLLKKARVISAGFAALIVSAAVLAVTFIIN